jgi:hypothetical protein
MSIQFRFDLSIECGEHHANGRGIAMTWEDDELAQYEKSRARAREGDKLSSQREQLLDNQQAHKWNVLREAFTKRCASINAKAGRQILRSVDPQTSHLEIRREDSEKLEGLYDSGIRTVTFSCDVPPFIERRYELSVRPTSGNDACVWIDLQTKEVEKSDDIATSILGNFLRAGMF